MTKSEEFFKKQKKLFIKFVAGFLVFLLSIYLYMDRGSLQAQPVVNKPKVDLPLDNINTTDMRISRMEENNKLTEQKMAILEESLLKTKQQEAKHLKEKENLHKEIFLLNQEIKKAKNKPQKQNTATVEEDLFSYNSSLINHNPHPYSPSPSPHQEKINIRQPLNEVVMTNKKKDMVQHVDYVIPAGTTVKALLVSSVDSPTGVLNTSDPQPVKLRVLDDARLPKSVRVKLKGAIIIASTHGDLSSERVIVRIDRMTQTKLGGEFIETGVTGYVTGEDGKYGIRGVIVDKAGTMVANAAVSGFFSGISQFFQTSISSQNIKNATDGLPNNFDWDILKNSSLQGTGNAFTQVADYYIKKAEQVQPVIQVAAGRIVDITFTHGCDIGEMHNKKKIEKIREGNNNA